MKESPTVVPSFLLQFNACDLLCSTTCYFLGRMTAAAGAFASDLAKAWPLIPPDIRSIVRRDIQQKIDADDLARSEENHLVYPLGMNCDREQWLLVRTAWVQHDHAVFVARMHALENDDE